MKKNIALLFLSLFFFFQASAQGNDTIKVVFLSMNDMHARFDNFSKLKPMVDQIRQQEKNVFLFSAGDNFTGNPIVDMHSDKGYPMIDLMNDLGFMASAVGNHEFDYGQDILLKRMKQAKFPYLSANIKDANNNLGLKPYHIFTLADGTKIGVVSAIQLGSNGLPDSHPSRLEGLSFEDGVVALKKLAHLRDSCQIFIGLTHLGFEKDIELADAMPSLDVILGGHSHTLTKPSNTQNGVLILQAGSGVRSLGKVTVYLVNGKVVKKTAEMLDIQSFPSKDQVIADKIAKYNDNPELNVVVGTAAVKIDGKDELGSFMTDAVTSLEGVKVAFQNGGGIRSSELNQGPITITDIYKLDPFGNEVILFKLTGKEIKSLILNSFKESGKSLDLYVSGMTYTVITDKDGNGIDVDMRLNKGKKVKDKQVIPVAMNSYIASSYKFDHADAGKSLFITTAQAMIKYLKEKKEINYSGVKRTFVKSVN